MTPEERKIYNKEWRKNNPDYYKKYNKQSHIKEYNKQWFIDNKKKVKENQDKFLKENPDYWKDRQKVLLKNPTDKIKHYLRVYVGQTIKEKNQIKKKKTLDIVGLESWDKLREHIESQWTEGMTWDNHGVGKDNTTWHIDHIIPLDSAQTEEDIYKLNHYTNLQPMWGSDNIKKSNRL